VTGRRIAALVGAATVALRVLALADVDSPTPATRCVGCAVDVEAIRRSYTREQWAELTRGEVVQSEDERDPAAHAPTRVAASALIPYPPEPVWQVVTDFESRPQFVPGVKEARILRTDGDRLWVAEHLHAFFLDVRFVTIVTLDPEHGRVSWVMDREAAHDIADTTGSWDVVPLHDRRVTLVRYRTAVDSGKAVPGFVEQFFTARSLPKMVEGVRNQVQRRFPLLQAERLTN
jgi:ribosome-associated toxin RatA of RatAB toxin-antitoxin module